MQESSIYPLMVLGIDEVGRGAWAGPLVVAAVGLAGEEIDGLTDSKMLSKKKRGILSLKIKQTAPIIGIGWVSARDIDVIGLSEALKLAARRAVGQCDVAQIDQIIIDGTINLLQGTSLEQKAVMLKKADLLVPSVSAASIIAKVARDQYMTLCDRVFSGYGFAGHVGYGAARHRLAIDELGVTPLHRMCFEPMRSLDGIPVKLPKELDGHTTRTTTHIGQSAEDAAGAYLEQCGYKIIDRNWKTKWCEIDIIATKEDVVYFVEVKFRMRDDQGGGLAAITPRKLSQMRFAAKLWLQKHGDYDARLSAVELSGTDCVVSAFIETIV